MTIRNYLFLRTTGLSILVLPIGVLAIVVVTQLMSIKPGWSMAASVFIWFTIWFVMLARYSRRIKCPRCDKPLGIAALAANRKQISDCTNACPNCGVGFDERMSN